MATPGWYPDPAGQPGAYRYWDGQQWGADVTDNPSAAAPGGPPTPPPAPTPPPTPPPPPYQPADPTVVPGTQPPPYQPSPGAHGQPGWPAQPSQPPPPYLAGQGVSGSSGGGSGKVVGLVLLALALVVALGVGTFFVIRAVGDDDTEKASDTPTSQGDPSSGSTSEPTETADPTEEPTDEPTEEPSEEPVDPFTDPAVPTPAQCTGGTPEDGATGLAGGQFTGGGLTMPRVRGFDVEFDQAAAFTFADGVFAPSKVIERTETTGWVAVHALGGLNRANGFTSPGQAAGVVLECMSRSQVFYEGLTGATLLDSRATTVGGADAWVMDAEIRIDVPELQVEGDIAKVVVVDTGDPGRYGLFASVVPIGDQTLIAQQQAQEQLLALR